MHDGVADDNFAFGVSRLIANSMLLILFVCDIQPSVLQIWGTFVNVKCFLTATVVPITLKHLKQYLIHLNLCATVTGAGTQVNVIQVHFACKTLLCRPPPETCCTSRLDP